MEKTTGSTRDWNPAPRSPRDPVSVLPDECLFRSYWLSSRLEKSRFSVLPEVSPFRSYWLSQRSYLHPFRSYLCALSSKSLIKEWLAEVVGVGRHDHTSQKYFSQAAISWPFWPMKIAMRCVDCIGSQWSLNQSWRSSQPSSVVSSRPMRNTEISHLWNSFANHLGIGRTATTQLFGQKMDCNEPWDLQSGKPRTGSPFIPFKLPARCRHAGELTWRTFSGRCSRHRQTQGSDNSSRMPLSHLLFEVGISWMHSQFRQIYLPSPNSAWMLWRKRAETVACTLSTWSAPWRNLSVFNHNKASNCQCVCDWRIIQERFEAEWTSFAQIPPVIQAEID